MTPEEAKKAVGFAAVDAFVTDGMTVGLGTGTTAYWAILRVAERVAAGWKVRVVPTSDETARLCSERGVELAELLVDAPMEVAIDGADEVAPDFSLIKGGGGAHFREKTVALAAERFVVIVTENKLVSQLGAFPLPVEVVPFAVRYVEREIAPLCPAVARRQRAGGGDFLTDNGNFILDCHFGRIPDPGGLDQWLREIHGVVATGIFAGITDEVLVATETGEVGALEAGSKIRRSPEYLPAAGLDVRRR